MNDGHFCPETKTTAITSVLIKKFCMYLSGKNLSEERFFPRTPFPKTFNRILPLIGRSTKNVKTGSFTGSALSGAKLILKVLGKEFEGEPFFKRVSLNRNV